MLPVCTRRTGWGGDEWCPAGVCLNGLNPSDNQELGFEVLFSFPKAHIPVGATAEALQGQFPKLHAGNSISLLCPGPCGSGVAGGTANLRTWSPVKPVTVGGALTLGGGGIGFVVVSFSDGRRFSAGGHQLWLWRCKYSFWERSWEDQVNPAPTWLRGLSCEWTVQWGRGWLKPQKPVHRSPVPSIPVSRWMNAQIMVPWG